MHLIRKSTEKVNPGQILVIVLDQPLYTIAKKIQCHESQNFGEDEYVVLMGGLHIEMSFLGVIGEWLDGSGWSTLITKSGIITEGMADSVQKGSLTSRGQWGTPSNSQCVIYFDA